jgi:A/G-specific adenine glycosylase
LPELPETATDPADWARQQLGLACRPGATLAPLRHAFTHFVLDLQPLLLEAEGRAARVQEGDQVWLELGAHDAAALPTPVRRILDALATPDLFSPPPR